LDRRLGGIVECDGEILSLEIVQTFTDDGEPDLYVYIHGELYDGWDMSDILEFLSTYETYNCLQAFKRNETLDVTEWINEQSDYPKTWSELGLNWHV